MKKNYLARLFTFLLLLPVMGWGQTYTVSTLAGSGNYGYSNGTGIGASFHSPSGLAIDDSGNVYVADRYNNRIRKITSNGVVTTFAGSGNPAFSDGIGTNASFNEPIGIAIDNSGNLFVADRNNNRIRKITSAGVVTTVAGSGNGTFQNGTGAAASFNLPSGIAVANNGDLFVADNQRIRKITSTGLVTTVAGDGVIGFADGAAASARFTEPNGIAVDLTGNVFVADGGDFGNARIRKITTAGLVTTIAGSQNWGNASLSYPFGLARDETGNIFVSDYYAKTIRKITNESIVTIIAGATDTIPSRDGPGIISRFHSPAGVAVDGLGNIYVADAGDDRIRKLSPDGCTTPTSPSVTGSSTFCLGGSTILTSSAATGNLWSTSDTTRSITVNTAGNYSVRVVSGACTSANSNPIVVSVTSPAAPQIAFDSAGNRCIGSEVIVSVAGTYNQYRWNNGATTRSIAVRGTGVFSAEVQDSSGCWSLPSRTASIVFDSTFCQIRISIVGVDSLEASVYADRYEWFLNGIQLLSGNNGRRIPIQGFGTYTVRSIFNGRTSPLSSSLTIMSSNKFTAAAKFEVFPNPATDKVTIKTTATGTLEILNTLGQAVITQTATDTNEINLSKLAKGVYTVRFNGGSKILVVK